MVPINNVYLLLVDFIVCFLFVLFTYSVAVNVKGEESVIKAEATSETIEFHCNISISEQDRRENLAFVQLFHPCDQHSTSHLLTEYLNDSYELSHPIHGEGGSFFLNNFTGSLNLTYLRENLQDQRMAPSFCIGCSIKLKGGNNQMISKITIWQGKNVILLC